MCLKLLWQNSGINSEASLKFTCFNILRHAASANTSEFIFTKMRITIIMRVLVLFWQSHIFVY